MALREKVTLTCLATAFTPAAILVTWTKGDQPVARDAFSIFGPQRHGDAYAVFSAMSVPATDWLRGEVFSCVVGHDGLPMRFVQKNLDKSVGKPTAVNVSVVLDDADVGCY